MSAQGGSGGVAGRAPVTLRHLLRRDELAGAIVVGPDAALDVAIRDVVVAATTTPPDMGAGVLVVAGYRRQNGFEAEVLLRHAHSAGAAAVVLPSASRLMLTTTRLAESLHLPLVTLPDAVAVDLAWRLARHVHEPERFAATLVPRMLKRLRAPVDTPSVIVDAVATELGSRAAVLRAEGAYVAGELEHELPHKLLERPVPQSIDVAHGHLLCAPAFVEDRLVPELWLVAELPPSHATWVDASLHALTAAAMALSTWAARQRLIGERDARDRSTLLADLLDQAPALTSHVAARAVRAGWRLEGWHVGIMVRCPREPATLLRLTPLVRETLASHGLTGPVVERADGWVCWVSAVREPSSASHREVTERVRAALEATEELTESVAGIGRPYAGSAGLVHTLNEAREAALFAGSGRRRRVEHIDELGVNRVLSSWYRSEAFRSYAESLLAPLAQARGEPLLETLRAYLESESSTSSTASVLNVHRNTVAARVAKAESLLAVNLANPDERLVLQLACRILQVGNQVI